ncbi:MAG: DNA primase [Spirochaetes bacterium]|nr:DNA primase [Spirochaetota bacterium]
MRIPDRALAEIQSRLDLAEVVGEYTVLARRGGRWWGCCPFHQEKTPSFSVTPEKGVFYCFGCQKGGGLFQFVMEAEKVPFRDAVELLAKKAGVELPHEEEEPGGIRRETYLELNRRVAGSFRWLLQESPAAGAARRYLAGRRVSDAIAEAFQLGWAPPDRRWLWRFLSGKSYTPEFLARTGLFNEAPRGGEGRSSLLADRIMFPIANARSEVLAFGGRALGDGQPKYLNSPETAFFRKGENLFGIEKAGPAIREAGCFHLVEGYMDVLAMHQAGVTNTVAPLGTAFTEQQVRVLKRWTASAVLVFDGDEAGTKATLRAIELCERQEVSALVVALPAGRDPADFVEAGEEEALRALLAGKRPAFPFLLDGAVARFGRSGAEAKEQVRDFLFPFAAAAASRLRAEEYLRQVADVLGASPEAIAADFDRWQARQRGRMHTSGPTTGEGALPPELFLMLALSTNRDLFPGVRAGGVALADLEDARARALYVALEEGFRGEEAGLDALLARLDDAGLRELVVRKAASGEFDMNPERIVADSLRRIRQRGLQRDREAVQARLRRLEGEHAAPAEVRELLAEKQHLDSELAKLGV